MKNNKIKLKISTITLILVFAISGILISLSAVNAQSSTVTYPLIGATPNPVGVNQETLLLVGITQQTQATTEGWENITVTVEKPDGSTEILGPFRTDSTGLTGAIYVPTMVGTYTLQTNFPRQFYNHTGMGFGGPVHIETWMEASTSDKIELVVQEDPIQYYPAHPLPDEYWTRPVDAQLREWSVLMGSWLTDTPANYYAPYNEDAPETPHILWVTPLTTGGLVGGASGEHAYEGGDAYEGKFGAGFFGGGNPLIISGRLYYEKYAGPDVYKETACVDLHTGKELWSRTLLDNRTITRGQLFYWDTYDYHGVYDYLWVQTGGGFFDPSPPTWNAFDSYTGDWVYALVGVPSGTLAYGPKGELLIYSVDQSNNFMTMWNSSAIPDCYASNQYGTMGFGQWEPMGKTIDAQGPTVVTSTTPFGLNGYQLNVSIPENLPGSVQEVVVGEKVVGVSVTSAAVTTWALSLERGEEGELLFMNTWQAPDSWTNANLTISFGTISCADGLFTLRSKEDRVRYGFSTDTGDYLWVTEPLSQLDHLMGGFPGESGAIANGIFYSGTVSGVFKAFDAMSGDLLWTYEAYDPLREILWSNNWPISLLFITDGKVYLTHTEHSPVDPMPRGAPFICLNATTGDVIFRIDGAFRGTVWGGKGVIGDSIIATMDTYDQRIYAIGKGPSATTVDVSFDAVPVGKGCTIRGKVLDDSPGTKTPEMALRFPNGVPAVSEESMSDWMLYVYKQFEIPMGAVPAVGVQVKIQIVDPTGTYAWIGTATTDATGNFGYSFVPTMKGLYTIIATFDGSRAYYGSYATTYLTADPEVAAYPSYPGYQGPSASEVANSVVANLPADATPQEVAQAVVNAMPEYPEQQELTIPEYTTMDIILAVLVLVAIIIGIISILLRKK